MNPILAQLQALLGDAGSRGFKDTQAQTHPAHPVVEISWYDAVEYARWVNKRLPTAEEWEKAARGTDGRNWSWGNKPDISKGNTRESEFEGPTAVFKYDSWPSPYGCCDMSGNVAEWTLTLSGSALPEESRYVIKGGCWMFDIDEAQVWKRHDDPSGDLWNALGFRCSSPVRENRPEDLLEDYERRQHARSLRAAFDIDLDDPAMIAVAAIARTVLAGQRTCELFHTTGMLCLRGQSLQQANEYFRQALEMAEALSYEDMQTKALEGMISIKLDNGDKHETEELLEKLLTIVCRRRSFEDLNALALAGRFYADTTRPRKSYEAFREAMAHYDSIRNSIKNNPILRKGWLKKNLSLFEDFIVEVLLAENKKQEALMILQRVKAASLGDLLSESRLVTAHGLPAQDATRAKSLWREIRQREISLEQSAGLVGNELEEYRTRLDLRTLRRELQALWKDEWTDDVSVFTDEDLEQLQALLSTGSNTTIVELFVTSKSVIAFALAPERGVYSVIRLDNLNREQLEEKVARAFTTPYHAFTEVLQEGQDEHIREKRIELFWGLEALLSDLYTELFSTPGQGGKSLGDNAEGTGDSKTTHHPFRHTFGTAASRVTR